MKKVEEMSWQQLQTPTPIHTQLLSSAAPVHPRTMISYHSTPAVPHLATSCPCLHSLSVLALHISQGLGSGLGNLHVKSGYTVVRGDAIWISSMTFP